ncbi:(deoxy)nucleoside triphosphate pyrophosphohydrolase [Sinobacterium caligoides]|uniref:(deoxy)nucleoside triphosphate pyrophosphohydrolase n=1 Tax=Sinobacterium caligoides TaxID=933926 RepID=UPI0013C2FF7D|nr:(deoxy)nucleoside triphosphate pyrophosphohydrolase [Sinobacterium caligoides]
MQEGVDGMPKEALDVVLAVIVHPGRRHCLLSKRPEGVHLAGHWEFPGGKVGLTEGLQAALTREVREELGLVVSTADSRLFNSLNHSYPERDVCLHTYLVEGVASEAYLPLGEDGVGSEGQLTRWVAFSRLGDYDFPAANAPIVAALKRNRW